MQEEIIQIKNLTKKFKELDAPALDNLTLSVKSHIICGLIGPDGAGKTTLLRLLTGLLTPSKGKILTIGLNPNEKHDRRKINSKTGYMPQKFGLYEDLTIQENLNLFASLKEIKTRERNELFEKLLTMTDLNRFRTRLAGALSGGMKQKLGLACALLGKPELLILDEPSVGVDPISRRELIKMVKELTAGGMSVIWSTSYLDEAQNFDECILLNEGKILFEGKPDALTSKVDGKVFFAKSKSGNNRELLKKMLKYGKNLTDCTIQGDNVRIVFEKVTKIDFFKPTKPRFEDAVIESLGGCPKGESELAKEYFVKKCECKYPVEAIDLEKKYGEFYAVKNNTFHIHKGEIFGLLGPNGAGKSTSFKMMCGLSRPSGGFARIMGTDITQNPTLARSNLGYMAQKFSLYGKLSVAQNLNFFAGVYGLNIIKRYKVIKKMVEIFDFGKYLNMNSEELPLGYKQRLSLCCAVMHEPAVLFLDEPTSGVDPLTRRDFWTHINALAQIGVTVLVTTHFMDEAEYCDRISLFYKGQTIATDTPTNLKHRISPDATMEDAFIGLIEDFDKESV